MNSPILIQTEYKANQFEISWKGDMVGVVVDALDSFLRAKHSTGGKYKSS